MKNIADIRLKGDSMELQFEWCSFDGDDCFNDFHINVITQSKTRRFDFGPCVIYGLRKLRKFFWEANQEEAGLGFRYPDIRCCALRRLEDEDGYSLAIRFEGCGLNEEFVVKHPSVEIVVKHPSVEIDDRFLTEYYDV